MKKVAVINDMSGFGRCSLTAAIPVLSVMGIEACPLPTAILTNQTGFESFYCDDYTDKIDIYTNQWLKMNKKFDGISTGYLANADQVNKIFNFINKFKSERTLLLVDPVMADGGKIYSTYNKSLCDGVKRLASIADVITPNLTELCILTNKEYSEVISRSGEEDYLILIKEMAHSLISDNVKTVVVTGIHHNSGDGEYIYNGIFTDNENHFCKSNVFAGSFSGTGDLFAAVIFGELVNGVDIKTAVDKATLFLEASIKATVEHEHDTNNGVDFEKCLRMLI